MKFFNAGVLTVLTTSLFAFGCGESTTKPVPGGLAFSKTAIVFAQVQVGQSNEQLITVENTSDEPLTIDSIELRESGQDGYSEVELKSSMDGMVLQPNEFQTITLVWTPKNYGADVGFVTINSANERYVLSFEAPSLPEPEAAKGVLSMSSDAYVFEYTTVNGVSLLELKAQNTGEASLQVLDVRLEEQGQDPLEEIQWKYAPYGPDNAVLKPGDEYTIAMKWTPKNMLYDEATVVITHTEGTERVVVRTPDLSVPPVPKGTVAMSAPRIVLIPETMRGVDGYEWTVTNTSDQPLELGRSGIQTITDGPGRFELIPESDEPVLMPGQSRTYKIRWVHDRDGLPATLHAKFYLPINVQAYALDMIEVPIVTQGITLLDDQPVVVDAMSKGESRTVYVIYENASSEDVRINDVFWSNPNGPGVDVQRVNDLDFQPVQNSVVPPNGWVTYALTLKTDSIRPAADTLIMNTSQGIKRFDVKVNLDEPSLNIAGVVDDVMMFGNKEVKQLAVANESLTQPLEIQSIHITNADHASFKLVVETLPIDLRNGQVTKLQPRAQLQLSISYDVAKPATDDAYLTIRTNDPRRPNVKIRLRP